MPCRSVRELLRVRAALGDHVAYAAGREGRAITYADLAAVTAGWADPLVEQGLRPGHRVALLLQDPLTFVPAYLGLVAAGFTVLPLNAEAPDAEWSRLAGRLGADVVVTDRDTAPDVFPRTWRAAEGRLTEEVTRRGPAAFAEPHEQDGQVDAAVLLGSSGTTGAPKVVPLRESQLLYVARRVAAHHRLGPDERGYNPLPLFHINAQVVGVLSTLVAGSSLVLDRRFHRTGFWSLLDSWNVTWLNAVPAILAILARSEAPDERTASRVRFARSASAPLPRPVLERFQTHCRIPIVETYGMTEAAAQITANPVPPATPKAGSVGRPVGVDLRVVNARRRQCAAGEIGSVEIRGPSVVESYVGTEPNGQEYLRPARTPDGWLVSGDLGYLDQDGFLFLVGRADDVINRGGEKVYPKPVEDVLRAHPDVDQVAVVGRPDPVLGETPIAYVTADPSADRARLVEELGALAASGLSGPNRPMRYLVVETLPAGPTGKINRNRLADLEVDEAASVAARAS
ncbi:MAG: AMP-binding protein [Candidatus Dormibacteraeota bacterium]|nr:AMP-binding protein [Candidatus Dormibacteraeota bacterium]MBO0760986.1 AMP-binding protein [Candidatus Dormibacteraeota bacterium]